MSTAELSATRPSSSTTTDFDGAGTARPRFVAGVTILGLIVLLALLAPLVTWHDPIQQNLESTLQGPSWSHPFGTDELGRDVWAQLVYGARTDLRIALLAVLFPFAIGTTVGLLAGYFGRLRRHGRQLAGQHRRRLPLLRPDHRARLRARPGNAEHLHRDHHRRLGLVRADRARRGARRQAPGIRARRPGGGTVARPHHGQAPPPERGHPGNHLRDVRHRPRHPRDRHPRLPRSGGAAADARLGEDDRRRPDVPDHALGAFDHSRLRRRHHRPRALVWSQTASPTSSGPSEHAAPRRSRPAGRVQPVPRHPARRRRSLLLGPAGRGARAGGRIGLGEDDGTASTRRAASTIGANYRRRGRPRRSTTW